MDTDSYLFSFFPMETLIDELKHFSTDLEHSDLDPSHELYSENNKKQIGNTKLKHSKKSNLVELYFQRVKPNLLNKTSKKVNQYITQTEQFFSS